MEAGDEMDYGNGEVVGQRRFSVNVVRLNFTSIFPEKMIAL
jgi:hypothetical protein